MTIQAGLYSGRFSEKFRGFLVRYRVTCYQISQLSGLSQAYLSRLKSGERQNPSPETIIRIGIAGARLNSQVGEEDVEHLLNSIGRSLRIME